MAGGQGPPRVGFNAADVTIVLPELRIDLGTKGPGSRSLEEADATRLSELGDG